MSQSAEAIRRRHERRPFTTSVRVSTIDPELDPASGRSFFRTSQERSVDISAGGLALRTEDPLVPGRRVLIEVDTPDGELIEAVGRVAWARLDPHRRGERWVGIGVEFLGGDRSELIRLATESAAKER